MALAMFSKRDKRGNVPDVKGFHYKCSGHRRHHQNEATRFAGTLRFYLQSNLQKKLASIMMVVI